MASVMKIFTVNAWLIAALVAISPTHAQTPPRHQGGMQIEFVANANLIERLQIRIYANASELSRLSNEIRELIEALGRDPGPTAPSPPPPALVTFDTVRMQRTEIRRLRDALAYQVDLRHRLAARRDKLKAELRRRQG